MTVAPRLITAWNVKTYSTEFSLTTITMSFCRTPWRASPLATLQMASRACGNVYDSPVKPFICHITVSSSSYLWKSCNKDLCRPGIIRLNFRKWKPTRNVQIENTKTVISQLEGHIVCKQALGWVPWADYRKNAMTPTVKMCVTKKKTGIDWPMLVCRQSSSCLERQSLL